MEVMRTIVVVLTLIGAARIGIADPDPAPAPPTASEMFEAGRALLDAHQPGPACEKFEASLKLEPEALGTILNLGLCNEQLDKIATALRWFRRVQARASELKEAEAEAAAKEKTSLLAAQVATIKVAFSHPPVKETVVALDGVAVAEIDYARIEVDAGTHEITTTVPNHFATHDTITVADRETKTVTIAIAPPPPPPPAVVVAVAPPITMIDRGAHRRAQAYVLVGVGVGLLIGDTVLAVVAKHRFDETDVLATRDHWKNIARYGATSLFVAGGAAIGTAIYLYVKAPGRERTLLPEVSPEHLGLSLTGSF